MPSTASCTPGQRRCSTASRTSPTRPALDSTPIAGTGPVQRVASAAHAGLTAYISPARPSGMLSSGTSSQVPPSGLGAIPDRRSGMRGRGPAGQPTTRRQPWRRWIPGREPTVTVRMGEGWHDMSVDGRMGVHRQPCPSRSSP